jgi:UDP-N-acetyl-D-mannosaminuronic acid dehydrogenase
LLDWLRNNLLADRFDVDVWAAIEVANRQPAPGDGDPAAWPGRGGHYISVDPWFLVEAAPDLTPPIFTAREVNDAQLEFVVDLGRRRASDDSAWGWSSRT